MNLLMLLTMWSWAILFFRKAVYPFATLSDTLARIYLPTDHLLLFIYPHPLFPLELNLGRFVSRATKQFSALCLCPRLSLAPVWLTGLRFGFKGVDRPKGFFLMSESACSDTTKEIRTNTVEEHGVAVCFPDVIELVRDLDDEFLVVSGYFAEMVWVPL